MSLYGTVAYVVRKGGYSDISLNKARECRLLKGIRADVPAFLRARPNTADFVYLLKSSHFYGSKWLLRGHCLPLSKICPVMGVM
jgi:hypothetical protein